MLDAAQCIRRAARDRDADRAVGFIDLANRGDPQRILGRPAAADQPGRAAVAGTGVDLGELDQAYDFPALINRITTTTIASA